MNGNTVRFQKIGTGTATTKSRNGQVTPMELAHTIKCNNARLFAAEHRQIR